MKHLLEKGISIEKLIQVSDGAPTQYQYKGKMNFADLSYSYEDFGFQSEKHYFGSRHGKLPCDREIGTVKKSVVMAIKSRRAEVSNTKTFHGYCRIKNHLIMFISKGHVSVLVVDDRHVAFCEYNGSVARIICVAVAILANEKLLERASDNDLLLCRKSSRIKRVIDNDLIDV